VLRSTSPAVHHEAVSLYQGRTAKRKGKNLRAVPENSGKYHRTTSLARFEILETAWIFTDGRVTCSIRLGSANRSRVTSKAEFEMSFKKNRLEMWVWESGQKIDPATGVRFYRSLFSRKNCIYLYLLLIPSNPLITFWNGRSLPSWEVLWGASSLNVRPLKYCRQNSTKKAVVQNIIISGTMLIITIKFYLPPTDHPTPQS